VNKLGAYRFIRDLGSGPDGPVYLARGPAGEVAIRKFQPEGSTPRDRERFLAAGRLQMVLTDPSIVQTLEVIDEAEDAAVVMQYSSAATLQQALIGSDLSLAQTNVVLRSVALALDFAHSRGVVHGNLKPASIFLLPGQQAAVRDFAISLNARRDPAQPLPGHLRHPYLSPEHSDVPMFLDARSDQYSLAAIAYELYTGRLPSGSAPDYAGPGTTQTLAPSLVNRDLPSRVDAPLMRALSRNPAHRYSCCIEFISALSASLPANRKSTTRRFAVPAAILGFVVIASAAGYSLFHTEKKPRVVPVVAQTAVVHPPVVVQPDSQKTKPKKEKHTQNTPEVSSIAADAPKKLPPFALIAPEIVKAAESAPTVSPAMNVSIKILSRSRLILKDSSFAIDEPTLGELGHGDLKALVLVDGGSVQPGRLTLEWTVNGVVTDRQKAVVPNEAVEYNNEPTSGAYKITVRLDGRPVHDFNFRITP
jgi:eukaryotic-like serine/threonine-protein kinase